ncbi:protein DOG1-like 3 [Mercurialis annua]|uniref:protein DOG1-like 3 n=1 Tax=Mercurialis annua TaxID=3986 RepID=UPI00215EB0C7|nr:protein DOG1-like 3 [Mercurialis annua]
MQARMICMYGTVSARSTEIMGIREALSWLKGTENIIIESDARDLILEIRNPNLKEPEILIEDCYRPSIYIRLLYSLCGSQVETLISEYLDQGSSPRTGNLGELSSQQMHKVNDLHCRIVKQEEQLTSKQASLQENMADDPVSLIAKEHRDGLESYELVNGSIQKYEEAMCGILQEADNLRLTTLKELLSILTPFQAVDFLAAYKKLHLCLHEWGKIRDVSQNRTN